MSNSGGIFQALSILSSKYSRTLFIYYTITVFDGITVIPAHTLQVHYVFQILYLQTAIFIFFFISWISEWILVRIYFLFFP